MNLESYNGTPVSNIDINAIVAQTVTQTIEQITPSIVSGIYNQLANVVQYPQLNTNLDNCTDVAHEPPITDNQEVIDNMGYARQRVLIGYDAHGKPMHTQVSGRSQDERNDAIVKAYVQYGRIWEFMPQPTSPIMPFPTPTVVEKPKTDFVSFAEDDYKFRESRWAASTLERERSAYKRICKHFEGRYIEDITIEDIQTWMNILEKDGLSLVTIKSRKGTLERIFDSAIDNGLISKNPAKSKRLYIPGYDSEGTQALSMEEYKRLMDLLPTVADNRKQLLLSLFIYTGMRRSEVLGLRWGDIDFNKNMLHVQRAVTYPDGFPRVKGTKSKAGNREIPVADPLREILLKHKSLNPDSYVITNDSGELFETANNYMTVFNELREDIGLPEVDALVFRSTFATMMAAAGVEPKTLQGIMGHADFNITMNVYAKVSQSRLVAHRNTLPDFFKDLPRTA